MFSGVFKWQNKEFTDVFRHSAWVFSRFLGQRTTRKCRETACSPTFTHRLMRCFPSLQNFFLQENAPFSVSNALIFAHLLRFQCDLMLECNLVLYSLVFSFKILTFVVVVLFFPAPAIGALNDIQILGFSPRYPSMETSNEKLSMYFWTLLLPATQLIAKHLFGNYRFAK